MCELCERLFERLEYAEKHGLITLYTLLHEALAEHGKSEREHQPSTLRKMEQYYASPNPYNP